MAKMTRRRKIIEEKVDYERAYPIGEAVALLNEISGSKFNESLDISVNLSIDPKKSDQTVRGATSLPHGSGKEIRVAVFAQGANADEAQEAGADIVGFEDLAEEIKKGELDFDVLIATPDSMRLVGQLGKVLGPVASCRIQKRGPLLLMWPPPFPTRSRVRFNFGQTAVVLSTEVWANWDLIRYRSKRISKR